MKIVILPEIDERKLGEELCLSINSNSNKLFILNESGAFIWNYIKNNCSISDISEKITQNYKIYNINDINSTVKCFLKQLSDKGIILYEE
jgi:coenzyme PQQ synthesis protein D (PqqD)